MNFSFSQCVWYRSEIFIRVWPLSCYKRVEKFLEDVSLKGYNEEKPWLIVQLNKVATITSVTVGNRKDCCGDLLRKLEIRVAMKEDLTNEVFGNYVLFNILIFFLQNR